MKKLLIPSMLVAAFLSGCGGGGGGDHARLGDLRFITASADAPNMDVFVNGSKEVAALPYPGFSFYLSYNEGSEHVQFRPVTTGANAIDTHVDISALEYKTVVAYDGFAHLKSLVLTDDRSTPPVGTVRLRLLDLSPSAGKVDIYINPPTVNINSVKPSHSNVAFENNIGYVNMTAGQYRIVVARAGTKNVLMDSGALDLASQEVRTVIVLDKKGGGTPLIALINYDLN